MGELSKCINIGSVLEEQLEQAGIHTLEELEKAGSRDAWLRIKAADPSACLNRLYALEGAIRGVRWHSLPPEVKTELKDFYQKMK